MPGTLPNPLWAIAREFGRRLESTVDLTVFGSTPGTLIPLPDALGGDPLQRPQLTQLASTSAGFLSLLRAKAHFLMLPERVIDDIRTAKTRFDFSGWFVSEAAETRYVGNTVLAIRLAPDTPAFVAKLGSGIGGAMESELSKVGTIFHELCHAWMVEIVAESGPWQEREHAGVTHYADARVTGGESVNPRAAYLEAAGDYVGDRVVAWYRTLVVLSGLLVIKGTVPADQLTEPVESVRMEYDEEMAKQLYGAVSGLPLASPGMPSELREALDAEVLDSLPLTRPFDKTPLRTVYDAILAR
ncbi:hypothetical protein [Streptomyces sp. NPDC052012]|uniref:hypothetical protein n=1 Tax=Streptomyces sp. NPDC052012 TaxID=3155051 RepID=UPI00344B055F